MARLLNARIFNVISRSPSQSMNLANLSIVHGSSTPVFNATLLMTFHRTRRKATCVQHFFVPDRCLSWVVRLTWPVPVPFLVLPTHSLGPNFRFVRLVIQCLFCVGCDSSFCHRVGLYLCYVCVYVLCVFLP